MASDSREERRRRIIERGSDRMALITGQIRNFQETSLPPSPSPSTSAHSFHEHIESSPSLNSDHAQTNAVADVAEDAYDGSSSKLVKEKAENDTSEFNNSNTARASTLMEMPKMQAPVAIPSAQKTLNQPRFFSSKLMNSCVIASERTRAICSLIIASLVVIAAVDYPLLGIDLVSSQSMIASRPLYMVLLMDVTIVLTRMYRERGNTPEEAEDERLIHNEDRHNLTEAIKLLERGLAIYQAFRGVFIDCSIYLVVVICGLSLV